MPFLPPLSRSLMPALFGFAALAVVAARPAYDLRAFLRYDREVRQFIVTDPDLFAKSYSANESMPFGFNFVINVVILGVGPGDWMSVRPESPVAYILTSPVAGSAQAAGPACIVPTREASVSFRLVQRPCWSRRIAYERGPKGQ
jgi:hypothetical protein